MLWFQKSKIEKTIALRDQIARQSAQQITDLQRRLDELEKLQGIVDAESEAKEILREADATLKRARHDADLEREAARNETKCKAEEVIENEEIEEIA